MHRGEERICEKMALGHTQRRGAMGRRTEAEGEGADMAERRGGERSEGSDRRCTIFQPLCRFEPLTVSGAETMISRLSSASEQGLLEN